MSRGRDGGDKKPIISADSASHTLPDENINGTRGVTFCGYTASSPLTGIFNIAALAPRESLIGVRMPCVYLRQTRVRARLEADACIVCRSFGSLFSPECRSVGSVRCALRNSSRVAGDFARVNGNERGLREFGIVTLSRNCAGSLDS